MKYLILSSDLNANPGRFRLINLANHLSKSSEVHIFTPSLGFYKYDLKVPDYDFFVKNKPHVKTSSFLNILRKIRNYFSLGNSYDANYISWLKNKKLITKFILENKIDKIFVSAPPFSILHIVPYIMKKCSVDLYLDMRDALSLHPYTKPGYIDSYIEKKCFELSKYVLFTAPSTLSEYSNKYPNLSARFKLVYNGFDYNVLKDYFMTSVDSDKIDILYGGSVYAGRDLSFLIDAIKQSKNAQSFRLNIVGISNPDVNKYLEESGINFRVYEFMKYKDFMNLVKNVFVMVVVQGDSTCSKSYPIPSKIYESIFFNRHIIYYGPTYDSADIISEYSNSNLILDINANRVGVVDLTTKYLDSIYKKSKVEARFKINCIVNDTFVSKFDRNVISREIETIMTQ